MKGSWSVRHRLTWQLTGLALVLVVGVTGLSVWSLDRSTDRWIETLATEELAEARAAFLASGRTRADFHRIAAKLGPEHPSTPLAFRVWAEGGSVWDEAGATGLLASAPSALPAPGPGRFLNDRLFWQAGPLDDDKVLCVVVDATWERNLVGDHAALILALGAGLAVVTVFSGVYYARRIAHLLRDVARRVREPRAEARGTAQVVPEEIREVADALEQLRAGARAEIERQQLMVAGLAHELRSPIQNLLGQAEVALLREREAAEYRALVESQVEELRDLGCAVDNLVSLCASRESGAETEMERFDLGREAELRLAKERSIAARRGVGVDLARSGPLHIRGDREAILLALRNLVRNAVEWSPPGATVAVRLDGGDGDIAITVDDAGPGVPVEERERIFEPFHRGEAVKGGRVGYGLGLALTQAAVAAHDGTVVVEPSPAGGARFHVRLPRGSA